MTRIPDLPVHKDASDTIRSLRKPRSRQETGWLEVIANAAALLANYPGDPGSENGGFHAVFKNNWQNTDPTGVTYPKAAFYMSHNGEIRFRGHLTGGTPGPPPGGVAFVLPQGYRPEATQDFIVPTDTGGYATIRVFANGDVCVLRVSG